MPRATKPILPTFEAVFDNILSRSNLLYLPCKKINQRLFDKLRGDPKCSILFFIPKLCFTIVFHISEAVQTAGPGESLDTNMNSNGRYTPQQRIKIIEAYFATKLVLLTKRQCRRDFGRDNAPDRRTIQRLVDKFRETGSLAEAHKGSSCQHSSAIIPKNIQNLQEHLEESPRKSTRHLSQKTGISRTSVLRILHDHLKHFPYKIQILQRQTGHNKAEQETLCEDINQRIENNPGLLDLIFVSDEAHCHLNGHINKQDMHFWAQTQPHKHTHHPLSQEAVTVWCTIGRNGIIGPYFFEGESEHVTVDRDCSFLHGGGEGE